MYTNTNTVRVQCNWLTVTCWHRLARVPCWGCVSQTANPRPQWWPGLVLLWSECKYNVHANTNTVTQTQIQIMRSCLFNLNPSTLLYYISLSSWLWNIDDCHKYPMSNSRDHLVGHQLQLQHCSLMWNSLKSSSSYGFSLFDSPDGDGNKKLFTIFRCDSIS